MPTLRYMLTLTSGGYVPETCYPFPPCLFPVCHSRSRRVHLAPRSYPKQATTSLQQAQAQAQAIYPVRSIIFGHQDYVPYRTHTPLHSALHHNPSPT
jgi:hypothetical protein